ncbi:MAG: FMN-binding protein [Candidatus Brocadiia bacterium]|nr:MAG: FMN-binding protein [Candidatus Brocadiia bacterium]
MLNKLKYFWSESWLLLVSAFIFGLLIALTNSALSGQIEKNQAAKLYENMGALITEAIDFRKAAEGLAISGQKTDVYAGFDSNKKCAGFAFIASGPGFADKIKLVIAVDGECRKFLGFKVLESSETPEFGSKISEKYYSSQFIGAPAGQLNLVTTGKPEEIDSEIVAISGATVSSEAVVKIFNSYIDTIKEELNSKGMMSNGK